MEIRRRPSAVEGVTLLAVDGGLDHTTTPLLVSRMDALLQEGASRVVLDLSRLTYASSWGLAAMVRVHHHFAARGGRVAFADLHSAVATVLRLSRLDRLFDLYPTVEDALRSIAPSPECGGPKAEGIEPRP
ncbi:MAG: STAS domain-containing protein [Planctomycetes bacterium]|nr:STAS domain-containing protein [Planctomycetota bacterium]